MDPRRRTSSEAIAPRILVAEDDEDTRNVVVTALIEEGYDVIAVEDGLQLVECLEIIARDSLRSPDLIAMDIHMPGPSGLELLDELRSAGWVTPVVIMSSTVSHEVRARVERAGAAAVIEKPFDLFALRAAISSAERNAT
jgi:CheY-like chemotaxis protein